MKMKKTIHKKISQFGWKIRHPVCQQPNIKILIKHQNLNNFLFEKVFLFLQTVFLVLLFVQ